METLEQIFSNIPVQYKSDNIDKKISEYINIIGLACERRKGVYTVLVTLLYYKHLHPEQDIRLFQTRFNNGFSARSFDTKFVTPVLKKLGLPSMAESGWLTRSLEQPYPYDFDYKGAIPRTLKIPFLSIVDYVEKKPEIAYDCLCLLLSVVRDVSSKHNIKIIPLKNPEQITINRIMEALEEHFLTKYKTHNGAKLPVLAFYSIYMSLIKEIERYKNCHLAELSSLTACDRTNKASGDIEIFDDNDYLFEAIEIKLDKQIDSQIMRVVKEKIYKWNPKRYYVLSVLGIKEDDRDEIISIVDSIQLEHGCQVIINGLLPTIKYYLRLISKLDDFITNYSYLIEHDKELQAVHKEKWNDLLYELNK